ncbi:MAG TPA: glucodextranase DOMON-like domain-containing protein [Thermoanaerobaculia bacterium]|nr:glucodextranase DOMON-like domain-containing protein [Thermoanaerobaculia bacterium]
MPKRILMFAAVALVVAGTALAQTVSFKDPVGDDNGPGNYTYPTDAVYKRGSFDITAFQLKVNGARTEVSVTTNSSLEDPWSMGVGFAVQMVFVFIDKDGKEGSGFTKVPPGLNFEFAPASAWEKMIIMSPQQPARVRTEVEQKAAAMKDSIIIPARTRGAGRTITATIDTKDLGEGDPTTWGYQVIMQSNEGFPAGTDLLTRKVNEFEGQHRFGGGNDGDCDPHVMDLLAGDAVGDKSEIDLQHKTLAYECNPDGTAKKLAVVSMVHAKK